MIAPLDLFVEVADPAGVRYRWDANQAPGSRLRNFSFRTKLGEGFSDASGSLARRIDADYPDLELVNDITVVGEDGSIAYEGRLSAQPRELMDSHSIGVTLTGWMVHAKDRKFTEIYVDRDLGAWGPPSLGRKATMLAANYNMTDPSQATDPTDSTAGITTGFDGSWASPYLPLSEAWYDAGPGLTVGAVAANWKRDSTTNPNNADAQWTWDIVSSPDDKMSPGGEQTANLRAAGPTSVTFTPSTARRYMALQLFYNATPAGTDGAHFGVSWYKLAAYGRHFLPLYTGESGEPPGVMASDVIRDIARRYCPKLSVAGVMDTGYVIQHLAFKDRTFPYDAFLEINKYHLWHLGVWDNKILHFRPYDLRDYVWEIRTDDPGTTFSPQGPSTDDLFNGIAVTYLDVLTGKKEIVTPDNSLELADTNPANPWNRNMIERWDEIELSTPTLAAQALQIGKTALADRNRPKAPGTITVRGYIRDRAGVKQPVWKVRAGDTISLTNFPNDWPRLIHETSYDDESKTLTISVERPASALDAFLDRVSSAAAARGLA